MFDSEKVKELNELELIVYTFILENMNFQIIVMYQHLRYYVV